MNRAEPAAAFSSKLKICFNIYFSSVHYAQNDTVLAHAVLFTELIGIDNVSFNDFRQIKTLSVSTK